MQLFKHAYQNNRRFQYYEIDSLHITHIRTLKGPKLIFIHKKVLKNMKPYLWINVTLHVVKTLIKSCYFVSYKFIVTISQSFVVFFLHLATLSCSNLKKKWIWVFTSTINEVSERNKISENKDIVRKICSHLLSNIV